MAIPSSAFVLIYASLARAPEFAMGLASKMAAQSFEHSDLEGVQRWSRCYHELSNLYDADALEAARAS